MICSSVNRFFMLPPLRQTLIQFRTILGEQVTAKLNAVRATQQPSKWPLISQAGNDYPTLSKKATLIKSDGRLSGGEGLQAVPQIFQASTSQQQ